MPLDLNTRVHSPADALEAVTERVWLEYQRSGYLPEEWIEQIYRDGWKRGKPIDRETIRITLREMLHKLHQEQGYNPAKAHREVGDPLTLVKPKEGT